MLKNQNKMVNYSNKIKNALFIIKKFNTNVNVERTDNENTVYLFDYSTKKKTVGSPEIAKAVEKAMKQQDWPSGFVYNGGMLTLPTETINETVKATEPELKADEIDEVIEKVKRGRKKKTEEQTNENVQAKETENEA
jgi:hypothetical protein